LVAGGWISVALAEPATNEFAASANVSVIEGCALIAVGFHVRVQNLGFFPVERGEMLTVRLKNAEPSEVQQTASYPRQWVPFNRDVASGVKSIIVEFIPGIGPMLKVQFDRAVAYDVSQSGSFTDVLVAAPAQGSSATCKVANLLAAAPSPPPGAPGPGGAAISAELPPQRTGKVSYADMKTMGASLDEARAAIAKKNYPQAEKLLLSVLRNPENASTPEALETLGEARQKSGQTNLAIATYKEYLRRYPNSEAAPRVARQLGVAAPSSSSNGREPGRNWSLTGSVSSFYISDDSATQAKDITIAPNPNAPLDAHVIHQHTILNNVALHGSIDGDEATTKFQLSGSFEGATSSGAADQYLSGISAAWVSSKLKETDLTLALGRQSISDIGVLGRVDGGYLSWQINNMFRFSGVVGAANYSSYAPMFYDSRYLIGGALDVANVVPGLDTSFFAVQQNDRAIPDSRNLGATFRYFQNNISALGLFDYDVLYNKLNAASFSGTYTFQDKSVLSATANYQLVPYLTAWTALSGQPYATLYDMLKANSLRQVYQIASDQTPAFSSAMVSYTKPLTDNWQVGADATLVKMSGTAPPNSIDGTTPADTELFLSATLTGANLFKSGDMALGALRYARLPDMNVYFLDLGFGFPVNENIHVSPRLRTGYRQATNPTLQEYTVLPELLLDYNLTSNVSLESDLGYKYIDTVSPGASGLTKDFFFTLGVTANISNEGTAQCAGLLRPCWGAWFGGGVTPQQANVDALYYGRVARGRTTEPAPSMQPPQTASVPAFALESGLRYWLSTEHNRYNYYADTTTDQLVSKLDYASGPTSAGEAYFRSDLREGILRDSFLKGTIGSGAFSSGTLSDVDLPPVTTPYSKTLSSLSGGLAYWNLDVGYNVFTNDRLRVGAFAGAQQIWETANAGGCQQVAGSPICAPSIPSSIRLVTEKDTWDSIRAGVDIDLNVTDQLKWRNELALAATAMQAIDTHSATFGVDPASGHGGGFQLESALDFRLTDRIAFGLGGRWWRFNIDAVDNFGQLLRYQTDRYGGFAEASYRF